MSFYGNGEMMYGYVELLLIILLVSSFPALMRKSFSLAPTLRPLTKQFQTALQQLSPL
jgi:hypothetical protein